MRPTNMYLATVESYMAKVVNLRSFRKRTERLQGEQRAAERRVLFGRPKGERDLLKARAKKAVQDLDRHRMENGEGR